jgi:hypothetical protein
MQDSIERCRVATEEVSRHDELIQPALFSIRGGFDTRDCSFLNDVEVFGRVGFSKKEAAFAVMGFGQFLTPTSPRWS